MSTTASTADASAAQAQMAQPERAETDPRAVNERPVGPQLALEKLTQFAGLALIDLDETLYLSNTTEDFIDLAQPSLIAFALMRLLDLVAPWRWSGGETTRDVWRVQLIRWLFPWTVGRWKHRVSTLASRFANRPLVDVLKSRSGPVAIVTVGFRPIVEPLVAALGLAGVKVVSANPNTFVDRRKGKLQAAVDTFGEDVIGRALVLSDSPQDLPLLNACACPLYTVWPEARYRPALSGVYFPGQYISRIKRPGEHYFRRAVLQEDFAYWVLASVALAPRPVTHVIGLFFLLLSFWIIYEAGYVDNDLMAAKWEKDPKLTKAFFEQSVATPTVLPWIWTVAMAAIGLAVLRWPTGPSIGDLISWSLMLIGTYLWFLLYNRTEKNRRVWLFSVLQFSRAAAIIVLVPILPIGAAILGAQVIARWMPYYLYRLKGKHWPDGAKVGVLRVLFFVILAVLLCRTQGWSAVLTGTTAAILVWSLFRASHDFKVQREGTGEQASAG